MDDTKVSKDQSKFSLLPWEAESNESEFETFFLAHSAT